MMPVNESKHIVVELDDDGFVVGIWCPDETYVVDILDRADMKRGNTIEIENYYIEVEKCLDNLKNCY